MTSREKEQEDIERQLESTDFWSNKEKAQSTIQKLKTLKELTLPFHELQKSLNDIVDLSELADDEGESDKELETEIAKDLQSFAQKLEKLEFRMMLNGKNDCCNAYLNIHAGAGGTESCDWTSMLLRMYSMWAEKNNYSMETIDLLPGDEAGIKRVTTLIKGNFAYGYLKSEIGVHRLVRISPFDSNSRRHTSFAAVDVVPEIDVEIDIEINEKDLRIDTYRASGAGGQHVNKTSSAVRITHLPTGIVAQCQNDRSQHKNRSTALKMLKSKLYQLKEKELEKEIANAYDEKGEIAWGHQIRSYVLQPYTMIKDLRTGEETPKTQSFLDGEIDDFLISYLKWKIGK
ncbi:MAG: peptide chain release factor 2 [Planctomycetes bacterium RIFCSPLOWO2_12_FULL_40_19]|nr:MAG: peptide chain release factor 2 [Planctomycetes bacterium RIFCSPLOWO2_12_FULL_40_19]